MKNLFALALMGSLLLAGCAGKKAMEDQAMKEVAPAPAPAAVEPAPPVIAEPAPAPVEEPPVMQAAEKIFFDFDSYLLSPSSKEALDGNALWLKDQPEVSIVIEGYADERGSDTYNLALGEKRSRVARDYLVQLGVDSDRIDVISYGEEKATQGATDESVWAQDRRADFVPKN